MAALAEALAQLGVEARAEDATLLSGPYSGTRTYLIPRQGGGVVLKLVPPDAPNYVRARANREARFFAELAPLVPLRLPRLLAACDDPCCLLFAAYSPAPPASAWPPETYEAFARGLAGLHARLWADETALGRYDWLRRTSPADMDGEVEAAHLQWAEMARQPHLADLLSPEVMSMVERLLRTMPDVAAVREGLPTCLCHGDCHAANLLFDPDRPGDLVWADWQEVGPGRGAEDLSFFVQRAMTDGADVPECHLYGAYHRYLTELVGPVTLDSIVRVADASELRTRLLQWPHYLAHLPSAATALSIRRISGAAARLGLR